MLDNFLPQTYQEYNPCSKVYTDFQGHSIFLGDVSAANDQQLLQKNVIKCVVTAASGMEHIQFDDCIDHIVYSLLDSKNENLGKYFSTFYQLMERKLKQTSILVHCFAGISRSATLVISYLMKKCKLTFKEAITEVRKYRPKVLPNLGFERQLKQYEKQLKTEQISKARRLVSKTSEPRKYNSMRLHQCALPQIMALGKTMAKNKKSESPGNVHPNSQMESRKMRLLQLEDVRKSFEREEHVLDSNYTKKMDDYLKNSSPVQRVLRRNVSLNKKPSRNLYDNSYRQLQYVRFPPARFLGGDLKFVTQKLIKSQPLH